MNQTRILHLLQSQNPVPDVRVQGWVKTRRDSKGLSFLEINDGSCLQSLQVVATPALENFTQVQTILSGSAVSADGDLVASPAKGQPWELAARRIDILNRTDETYPLQKKRHSDEFLRALAHLRPRTNKYGAMFRLRSEASFAIHSFLRGHGFFHIHTPILTSSDCEGAGELFAVSEARRPDKDGSPLFDKEVFLTVSGQLAVEMFALSLGNVYTFGPAFRAEHSNTARHAAEFWMVEPEMAFCDLEQNMAFAQTFVQQTLGHMLQNASQDLDLFARFVDPSLYATLDNIISSDFERISYKKAIEILCRAGVSFAFTPEYGRDLQTEHERFLAETFFKKPVFVYDYPRTLKPFYMRVSGDGQTVAAMDLLVPRIGELIGGSQREERLDMLERQMKNSGLSKEKYGWYLDSRRFGSVVHSGFGMGFERFLMLLSGVTNIRDVIAFPRTPGTIDF
ncbi:MAG: asparagine--tRNA ligase [Thermodesulfobacteriota bacterium]